MDNRTTPATAVNATWAALLDGLLSGINSDSEGLGEELGRVSVGHPAAMRSKS